MQENLKEEMTGMTLRYILYGRVAAAHIFVPAALKFCDVIMTSTFSSHIFSNVLSHMTCENCDVNNFVTLFFENSVSYDVLVF